MNHTRSYPIFRYDFHIDGLHSETGEVIKVISSQKVANAFGVPIPYEPLGFVGENVQHAIVIHDRKPHRLPIETDIDAILRIVRHLMNYCPFQVQKAVTRGALTPQCETVQCVSIPMVYKILYRVELTHQQKLDLGILVRDAIPEVRNRPKVFTIASESGEIIRILHYNLQDLPKIVETILKVPHHQL
jgi:hypothetical protein